MNQLNNDDGMNTNHDDNLHHYANEQQHQHQQYHQEHSLNIIDDPLLLFPQSLSPSFLVASLSSPLHQQHQSPSSLFQPHQQTSVIAATNDPNLTLMSTRQQFQQLSISALPPLLPMQQRTDQPVVVDEPTLPLPPSSLLVASSRDTAPIIEIEVRSRKLPACHICYHHKVSFHLHPFALCENILIAHHLLSVFVRFDVMGNDPVLDVSRYALTFHSYICFADFSPLDNDIGRWIDQRAVLTGLCLKLVRM
jgi:hypothetical protein